MVCEAMSPLRTCDGLCYVTLCKRRFDAMGRDGMGWDGMEEPPFIATNLSGSMRNVQTLISSLNGPYIFAQKSVLQGRPPVVLFWCIVHRGLPGVGFV